MRASDYRIVSYDDTFLEFTGYTKEDMEKGITQIDLITKEKWEEYTALVDNKPDGYLEHYITCKDGHRIFVFCFGRAIPEEQVVEITITDVTKTKLLKAELENIEAKFNSANLQLNEKNILLENIFNNFAGGIGVFKVIDDKAQTKYLSRSFFNMTNGKESTVLKYYNNFFELVYRDDLDSLKENVYKCLNDKISIGGEYRFKKFDGGFRWIEVHLSYFEIKYNSPLILAVFFDITAKKENEIELQVFNDRMKLICENKNEFLFNYDSFLDTLKIIAVKNESVYERAKIKSFIYNYSAPNCIFEEDKELVLNAFKKLLKTEGSMSFEVRLKLEDNEYKWFEAFMISRYEKNYKTNRISGRLNCINDEKLKQEELVKQAEKDSLTDIYNHFTFEKLINNAVKTSQNTTCALIMLDLDNFKLVNDNLGHYAGDVLLQKVAQTLSNIFKGVGEVARLGGDEFAAFIPNVENEETAAKYAQKICEGIRALTLDNTNAKFSASVGVSVKKLHEINFKTLYIEADFALYSAKRGGRNRYHIYDANADVEDEKSNTLENPYIDEDGGIILNNTDDYIFISDLETNDLLYVNSAMIKRFSDISYEELMKKKCYEIFSGDNSPCKNCTAKNISKNKSLVREYTSPISNKKFIIKERLIYWKNKKAKLETVIDVSNISNIHSALSSRFEFEDALYNCILKTVNNKDLRASRYGAMETIGEYYKAERCVLFIMNPDRSFSSVYQWHNDKTSDMGDNLYNSSLSIPIEKLKEFSNDRNFIMIDNVARLKDKYKAYYDKFCNNKIWSFYAIPLTKGEKLVGYIAIFNPNAHLSEVSLLNIVSVFLANEIDRYELLSEREYAAKHDRLTGLLNRTAYIDYVEKSKNLTSLGIIYSDINYLKKINFDFGLIYGNKIVVEISNIFKECFGDNLIFRFGGDDFVVVCENIDVDTFSTKVNKARAMLAKHSTGAALGYAWDDYDIEFNRLTDHAEQMMLSEKEILHKQSHEGDKADIGFVLDGLLRALKNRDFEAYLQPKVNMKNGKLYGAEALVRYKKADGTIVTPNKFVPLFEKTHTVSNLDLYIAEEICILLKKWEKENIPLVPISVNISRETLLQSDFLDNILALTEKYNIDKKYLELEITETLGDMEYTLISSIATKLHKKGFKLSMDDFGTKYSSISMLSFMQFDSLKLDRSIICDLTENDISYKVAKHVVSMCSDIGLECIAEGVETEGQVKALKDINCSIAQGYFYGKPMPIEEFEKLYKERI